MKPQFTLHIRQFNELGSLYIEKKHFPVYYTNLINVPNLSNTIDYSLICKDQTIYTGQPNQYVYILILCEDL